MLTAKEAERVGAVFSAVQIHPNPLSECSTMGIDPCLIMRHQWDETAHDDFDCSADRLALEQAKIIADLLAGLRDAK